jgi:hypothetical protein
VAEETKKGQGEVVSISGSPIHRHGQELPWSPAVGEQFVEQISAHIAAHLGPIETVFHEIVSDTVHIDVHLVKPRSDFPFVRLVTSGMSDLPMATPEGSDVPKYTELLITLPGEWRLDQESLQNEEWYWPVRLLKFLARLPHKHQTWLGWGHTVPNGDPPQPYEPNTTFCGAIVLPSVSVPEAFHALNIEGNKTVTFYSLVPLYGAEMNLKLRSGLDELLERFDRKKVSDIFDPSRPDVAAKRFGFW